MSFLVFLNSWPAWFKSKIIEKFSTPKLILNPLNKSAWNLQVKLDVAASSNAEKDRSELHKVWIFFNFSLERRLLWRNWMTSQLFALLKARKCPFVAKDNRVKFDTHLKSGSDLIPAKKANYSIIYCESSRYASLLI